LTIRFILDTNARTQLGAVKVVARQYSSYWLLAISF